MSLSDRLDRRAEKLLSRVETLKRLIARGKVGGEADREWLDSVAEGLYGADVCCGDFPIEGATGIDTDCLVLGADYQFTSGDELTIHKSQELDFVTCNYFEAFPNVLKALHEWHRVLKDTGFIAICIRDAEAHTNKAGPLKNRNRLNSFTRTTIQHYLYRAGFERVDISDGTKGSIRIQAWKS